ncbi:ATP-binding cassette, subfamily B [Actinopolymorpha cephalotaxi]|uniref:ATP-binding cassette subfamily B protein n=1 Tax=Actinopolymorpha cephalotaxi TaxID=504797 RepID=A0A1I2N1J1_9ACTN|nr:ABC transporter ATP-binding protein [Actinopolymorpha cephalotaxi]NYH85727.1 ATP-binding cassette subfamily B protein [Actinopolymorpha cephalotaxi]SFF97735.1 ATP-binding cassette, subfamily B [Actinopolymorpha cephalotaxi]
MSEAERVHGQKPSRLLPLRLWLTAGFAPSPKLTCVQLVLTAVRALAPLAALVGVKLVIDAVTGGGAGSPASMHTGAALLIGGFALTVLISPVLDPIEATVNDRGQVYIHRKLMSLVSGIPGVAHHENPVQADRVAYLRGRIGNLGLIGTGLVAALVTGLEVAATFGLLAGVRPEFFALPVLGLLRVWSGTVAGRWEQDARQRVAVHRRMRTSLKAIATAPRHGVEVRTSGLSELLPDRHRRLLAAEREELIQAGSRGLVVELAARLAFGLGYAAAIVYIVLLVRNGHAPAGDIALIVLLATRVDQTAGSVAGQVRGTARTWRDFKAYADLVTYARHNRDRANGAQPPSTLQTGITLSGVGFTYPQADVAALSDVNLYLPAGKSVALVGENGAGKSTLVKLLLRLYEPTAGSIRIDTGELADVDTGKWRASTSAGFQDFDRFEFRASDTVGVGDLPRLQDVEAIRHALARGDATDVVTHLQAGLDTQLGAAWTDGVDLSVGQWQRLALARSFMRRTPLLLVLDEPTAALDAEAEHALLERFARASGAAGEVGGITVLVSHRFSTVRMADLIVVLDKGRVVEVGDHDQLMTAEGLYAELFALQARAYT